MTDALSIHPATPDRCKDVLQLFGPNGAYSNCWCTWWLISGREFAEATPAARKNMLETLVDDGKEPGLLAYREGEAVGWVAVGPRQRYARMMSPRATVNGPIDFDDPGWVINCFYIPRTHRGRGIASALTTAAVDFAFERGATHVVAHPVDTEGATRGAADLFVGTLAMFLAAGFTEVERRRGRPVVRIDPPAVSVS